MTYTVGANAIPALFHRSRWATRCWRISRTDGVVLRFTEHDLPVWIGSEIFYPSDSADSSDNTGGVGGAATRRQTGLREQTTSIRGVLSSTTLTQDDFIAGRYDGATIVELWVHAKWPWIRFGEKYYVIDTVDFDDEASFDANLVSRAAVKLRQKRGILASRNCRHQVFDDLCIMPHTDGVTPSLVVDEWTIGFDAASYCTVSTVTDADYAVTLTLPSVEIASITASALLTLSWMNVIGDVWSVTCSAAHGATAPNWFNVTFSGVSGATSINGVTLAVEATSSNTFQINMASYPGTPSGGSVRSGVTTITTVDPHYFGGSSPSAFGTHIPIGIRGVTGSSPTINGAWADATVTGANTFTISTVTTAGGTGGTVSYEPEEDWFARGKLTWTGSSDDNYLQTSEIRTNTAAGTSHPVTLDIELYYSPGKPIATSDVCSILTGCQRRFGEDCRDKFENTVNFGGFPNMPASSRVIDTPDAF